MNSAFSLQLVPDFNIEELEGLEAPGTLAGVAAGFITGMALAGAGVGIGLAIT